MRNAPRAPERLDLCAPLQLDWCLETKTRLGPLPISCVDGAVLFSDGRTRLTAVDGATGKTMWTYPWCARDPLLHRGAICAWVRDDEAHLIDVQSGKPREAIAALSPSDGNAVAVDDRLVTYRQYDDYGRTSISCVGGPKHWHHVLGTRSTLVQGFAADERMVAFGLSSGVLRTLSTSTGDTLWERSWPELGHRERDGAISPAAFVATPTLADTKVLVRIGARLIALSKSGVVQWEQNEFAHYLYGRRLYGVYLEYRVVEVTTGQVVRKRRVFEALQKRLSTANVLGPILVSDTHVFVTGDASVAALDRRTGEDVWHHRLRGHQVVVAAADGRLYCSTDGQRLYAFSSVCREPGATAAKQDEDHRALLRRRG